MDARRGAPALSDLPRPEDATGSWRARASVRRRWHNQKYFTWVEQQGKRVDELRALEDPASGSRTRSAPHEIDRRLLARRQA